MFSSAIRYSWSKYFKEFIIQSVSGRMCHNSGECYLVYIDMTKRPCINIRIFTEIMTREKYGLLADPHTLPLLHDDLSVHCLYPSSKLVFLIYSGNASIIPDNLFLLYCRRKISINNLFTFISMTCKILW